METGWKWQAHKDRNNLFEKQANRTAACGGPVVTGVVNCAEGFWGITPDCLSDCLPSRAGNGGLVGCYIIDAIVAIGKAGGGASGVQWGPGAREPLPVTLIVLWLSLTTGASGSLAAI